MKLKQLLLSLLALLTSISSSAYEFETTGNGWAWTCEVLSESEKTVSIIDMPWQHITNGTIVKTPQTVTDSSTGITYSVVSLGKDSNSIYYTVFDGYDSEDGAFYGLESYTIIISEGVTSIHQRTFWALEGNGKIYLPYSLTYISSGAFWCDNLTIYAPLTFNLRVSDCTVKTFIPFKDKTVRTLCVAKWDKNGDGVVNETEAAAVTDLGEVFKGNTTITSFDELQYFTGLTSLQDNAFKGCTNLTSFIIPRNVTSIGGDTFRNCKNLISISVADGNTNYDSRDNCNAIIETATNKLLLGCTNTNIPMGVTSIGVRAFQWCRFTSIDIPNSVSSIGEDAFSWCPNLTSFIIPEGVTTIAPITFYQCTSLTTITIPSSLKNVKTGAFRDCSSLSKVIVPDIAAWCGIIYEGDDWNGDFPLGRAHHLYSDENTEITEVVIPEGVTRIEARAFRDADYVTSVTLPNSLTYIDQQAFRGMSHLTSINLPNGLTSLEHDLFSGCKALPTVTIPGSVTSIGSGAFWGCSSMNSINILDGVRIISQDAFDGCRSLTSITIPKSVTNIGLTVFGGCTSLTSMIVDEENTTYDSRNDCNAIIETASNTLIAGCQNTIIPESVTSIASYAFQGGCTGTTPVLVIPAGMRKIGDYSIDGCTGLTDVWCYATQVPNTSSNAFYDSFIQYKTLHVPAASVEAYSTTAPWSDFGTIIAIEEELNTENVDIASAEDLANFAARVNAGEIALSATLKADIDFTAYPNLMIGNNSYYRGEFNGAGHSIKLALNRTSEHAALFYRLSGYVHDLTITGTITTSAKYAGGIAGETSNATIERCQSRVNIISTVNGDGTHGGIVGAARPGSIIRDCLFSGSITGSQTKCCGGVSGWSVGSVSITNCLIRSTFSVSTEDSDILSRNSSTVTSSNNYFQGTWDAANNCTDVTLLTESQVESGEACYLLNNGRTDDEMVWYQTLGVDDCPVPDKRRLAVLFDNGTYVNEQVANIAFADANVKAICVANWDTNGDGELSEAEAAAVTDLGTVFKNNTTITSFNELQYFTGLTEINDYAFRNTIALTSVIIPENVTRIGKGSFGQVVNIGASNLVSVQLPDGLTEIDEDAFWECNKLKNINFPTSLRNIGECAFHNTAIESLILPEGFLSLGYSACNFCSFLKSIYIPSTVTSIGEDAFSSCNALHSIVVSEDNTVYDSRENCNALIESSTNRLIRGSNQTIIPLGICSIGDYAFDGLSNLYYVTIPKTVTSIGDGAFQNCNELLSVKVDIVEPPHITQYTFSDSWGRTYAGSATLYVPAGCKAAYKAADYWKEFKNIIEFIEGDVNSDEEVDVLDVVDIVRYVVDDPADTFVPILADINANGEVNVGDAVALVNEIAGDQNFVKPWRAPQQNSAADDVLTLISTDNGMSLCMENERNYTAFQFDLFLPAGTDVTNLKLNALRKQGHQLIYNKVEEGYYRVAAISTSNHTFSGYKGELLAAGLEGIANEDICLRNIRFFTTDGEEHLFDDIVMQSGTTTDIASPLQQSNGDEAIYNLAGQRIQKMQKGINIVNGKKVMSK